MKRIFLLSLLAGYAPVVLAQGQQEIPVMQVAADSTKYLLYQAGKLSPTFIRQLMPVAYNTVSLNYNYTTGKFIEAQGATKEKNLSFSTEGKTNIGKTHLWGSFTYTRVTEDSTRFAHQTRYDISRPFLYGSPGNIQYRRTFYKARVLGQHSFFNDRMPVVAGVDYNIGTHYSTNDPRGNINDYQVDYTAGTGYTWHKQLTGTVHGYYGYGSEVLNVSFKNPMYQSGTTEPTRHNWMVNGYAEAEPKITLINYRTGFKRNGVGMSWLYVHPAVGTLALTAKQVKEKQHYFNRSGAGFDTLSNYTRNITTLHALWTKDHWVVQFDYDKQKGEDLYIKYNANSYQYRYRKYNLKAVYTGKRFNYGIRVNNNAEERLDGLTGNHVQYKHVTVEPSIGWNYTTKQQHHWGADVSGHFTKSFSPFIYVMNRNIGYYTKEVIYYDYYYNAANSMGAKVSLQYTRHFKGYYAGIKGTLGHTEGYIANSTVLAGAWWPGKYRTYGNVALQFYF